MPKIMNRLSLTGEVIAVKENVVTGAKLVMRGKNIVTNNGEIYYAQMTCSTTPTDDFDNSTAGLRLGQGTTGGGNSTDVGVNTEVTTMRNTGAIESGYPKANDTETDNSGKAADVVTWHYYWSTTEGTGTGLNEGAIVNSLTGATVCLTHFDIGSTFDKTSSDTLRIFVNHAFSGTG